MNFRTDKAVISIEALRQGFSAWTRFVLRSESSIVITNRGNPVVEMIHPDKTPGTKLVGCWTNTSARAEFADIWEQVYETGGHAVVSFHNKPRAVIVPYVEPEAA